MSGQRYTQSDYPPTSGGPSSQGTGSTGHTYPPPGNPSAMASEVDVGAPSGGYYPPSLPRYSSTGSATSSYYGPSPGAGAGSSPVLSPLNPSSRNVNGNGNGNGNGARGYNTYSQQYPLSPGQAPGSAHPLSNSTYADSSPTLANDDDMRSEKLPYSSGSSSQTSQTAYSHHGAAAVIGSGRIGGLEGFYNRMSGYDHFSSGGYVNGGSASRLTPDQQRKYRPRRLGYLDGMKFLAAWLVLNGTFFNATLTDNDYTAIQRKSPIYIVRSYNLGVVMLLLLSGRSLLSPLWDIPSPNAAVNTNGPPGAKKPTISWPRLTRALLVRPFRFILPVVAIIGLQWGLDANNHTRNCNAVGMDRPYWALIQNAKGFMTLLWDLFTYYESETFAGQTFGGNLWTVPWFFQASYCVYVVHLMLGNLSSSRYWVYAILAFFSWTTYNFFFVALLGAWFADLAAHGYLSSIQNQWNMVQRMSLQIVVIVVAFVIQWVNPIRDHLNSGLATINVTNHGEITISDSILAVAILFVVETSPVLQFVFGNVVMKLLGRLSAGIYLLAPAITFTIVPDLALSLHNGGSKPNSILGITWVVLFFACFGLAIVFHFVVELPSKWAGEYFAYFIENWGKEVPVGGVVAGAGVVTQADVKKAAKEAVVGSGIGKSGGAPASRVPPNNGSTVLA